MQKAGKMRQDHTSYGKNHHLVIIVNQTNFSKLEDFQPYLPESFAKKYNVDTLALGGPKNQ